MDSPIGTKCWMFLALCYVDTRHLGLVFATKQEIFTDDVVLFHKRFEIEPPSLLRGTKEPNRV